MGAGLSRYHRYIALEDYAMPRFVRPAYMTLGASGVATTSGTGPRTRDGYLTATLTLRTASGDVSDPIQLDAGGAYADGSGRAVLTVPAGYVLEIDRAGTVDVFPAGTPTVITLRPIR